MLWVLGEGGDHGNQSAKSKVAHIIVARKQSKKKKKRIRYFFEGHDTNNLLPPTRLYPLPFSIFQKYNIRNLSRKLSTERVKALKI